MPFPDRAELVIVACSVLVVTLVGPGLTLPVLVRVLGLREDADAAGEAERGLAARARRAALDELSTVDREALGINDEQGEQVLDELRTRFARVGAALPERRRPASRTTPTASAPRTTASAWPACSAAASSGPGCRRWRSPRRGGRSWPPAPSPAPTRRSPDRVLRRLDVRRSPGAVSGVINAGSGRPVSGTRLL